MNAIKTFHNHELNVAIRTVTINGEPWFIAGDVCKALFISNYTAALTRLEDDEHTLVNSAGIPGAKNPQMRIVSEAGLYSLVLGCRKPEAKAFKRWVTHEVLPSIRKTGKYEVGAPKTHAEALRALANQIELAEKQQRMLELARPIVVKDKMFRSAQGCFNHRNAANSINVPSQKFSAWLIEAGHFYRDRRHRDTLTPKAHMLNKGYVRVLTNQVADAVFPQTVWTAAGLDWLQRQYVR